MDWNARHDEIQARHFRTGPRAFLSIRQDPLWVEWSFTFADMGMFHTIESRALASQTESEVFAGHYARFLDELYGDMGITRPSR